jgi:hypothetical protein
MTKIIFAALIAASSIAAFTTPASAGCRYVKYYNSSYTYYVCD